MSKSGILKQILFGSTGFILVLVVAFLLAAIYVNHKAAMIRRDIPAKIAIQPEVKNEKKLVIKKYNLYPFFLRIEDSKTGEDRFMSVSLYIKFVRKDLPEEVKTKREVMRLLIYKQLQKHFAEVKNIPAAERIFKEDLIPVLNTFFNGGGVYDIGFSELVIR